eukprot:TRINITY_DN36061_c0_g1_i1.p1 TRINITY_DN36061_c0_g1~~TRINITY_DN36061_c0_g1_i1.p1  ORF type:complete len:111 (+),score=10.19 TRINITY_DN36061_c0_g1_i1:200-532(+)
MQQAPEDALSNTSYDSVPECPSTACRPRRETDCDRAAKQFGGSHLNLDSLDRYRIMTPSPPANPPASTAGTAARKRKASGLGWEERYSGSGEDPVHPSNSCNMLTTCCMQ